MATFQGLKYIHPISILSNIGLRTVEGRSLRFTGADIGAQRWEFLITLEPQSGQSDLIGRLAAHRARHSRLGAFDLECPQAVAYSPALTTNVLASQARTAGNSTITADSSDSNASANGIKPGRLIRFNGHSKVYMVTATSGRTLTLEPDLVAGVANNERVFTTPNVRVIYDPSTPIGWDQDDVGFILPQIRLIEAL